MEVDLLRSRGTVVTARVRPAFLATAWAFVA